MNTQDNTPAVIPELASAIFWADKQIDAMEYGQVNLSFIVHDRRLTRVERSTVVKEQVV